MVESIGLGALVCREPYCAAAGLTFVDRFATWDADPYNDGGYAISVHRR